MCCGEQKQRNRVCGSVRCAPSAQPSAGTFRFQVRRRAAPLDPRPVLAFDHRRSQQIEFFFTPDECSQAARVRASKRLSTEEDRSAAQALTRRRDALQVQCSKVFKLEQVAHGFREPSAITTLFGFAIPASARMVWRLAAMPRSCASPEPSDRRRSPDPLRYLTRVWRGAWVLSSLQRRPSPAPPARRALRRPRGPAGNRNR